MRSHPRFYSGAFKCVGCHKSLRTPNLQQCALKSDQVNNKSNPFIKYIRSLKWVPIPLGVGFAYIGYQQYGHIVKREEKAIHQAQNPQDLIASDWQVKLYRALPLKALSRLWGRANGVELPEWLRPPLLKTYIWAFGCNLEEAAVRDLQHYKNLGEFFRRRLRPGCRTVDHNSDVTSPADGRVLHFGRVQRGLVEQVKGITYTLQGFLGPVDWKDMNNNEPSSTNNNPGEPLHSGFQLEDVAYHENVKMREDTDLYHCVIYLAPGDYHGFHSPTQWSVKHRRHFPGDLLSVNPGIARWVQGLFNLNERAVYLGEWQHGFFCMAAVGATNVGSIRVYHDRQLTTNVRGQTASDSHEDQSFSYPNMDGIPMKKGESFGEFNLGSTIVLVFEAPRTFHFNLKEGQKVKYGEGLGVIE